MAHASGGEWYSAEEFAEELRAAEEQVDAVDMHSSTDELERARVACQVLNVLYRDRLGDCRSDFPLGDLGRLVDVARERVLVTEELVRRGHRGLGDRFEALKQLLEALLDAGRAEDAEALLGTVRAFGADAEPASECLFLVATKVFFAQGRFEEALAAFDELRGTSFADDDEVSTSLMFLLGACLAELGSADADAYLDQSVALTGALYGEDDPMYAHRKEQALLYMERTGTETHAAPVAKVGTTPARPPAAVKGTPSPSAALHGDTPSPLAAPPKRSTFVRRLDLKA